MSKFVHIKQPKYWSTLCGIKTWEKMNTGQWITLRGYIDGSLSTELSMYKEVVPLCIECETCAGLYLLQEAHL